MFGFLMRTSKSDLRLLKFCWIQRRNFNKRFFKGVSSFIATLPDYYKLSCMVSEWNNHPPTNPVWFFRNMVRCGIMKYLVDPEELPSPESAQEIIDEFSIEEEENS